MKNSFYFTTTSQPKVSTRLTLSLFCFSFFLTSWFLRRSVDLGPWQSIFWNICFYDDRDDGRRYRERQINELLKGLSVFGSRQSLSLVARSSPYREGDSDPCANVLGLTIPPSMPRSETV